MSTIKDFVTTMKTASDEKTKAYDTTATVTRIEGNTAWVHIPGGVDETPVKMTIKAKEGDAVQVRVSDGKAFIVGNATAPPTDDTRAIGAARMASSAEDAARIAHAAANDAQESADRAYAAAEAAQASADEAERQAISATNSANSALIQLSTVEDVVDTLNWITNHGTMTSQAGQTFDPLKVYFVVDASGDYVVGGTHYSLVTDPVAEDIDSYYCLTIDEAVANYVASHLSLTNEGLYVLKDGSGYKVLVANTGVFLQNPSGATVASYGETAVTGRDAIGYSRTEVSGSGLRVMRKVTQFQTPTDIVLADIGYGSGAAESGTDSAPYASFGVRDPRDPGNYSLMSGYNVYASGYCSQSFGSGSTASGPYSHAEGINSTASGSASHAEGNSTAIGANAHSEGTLTTASGNRSHAEGYNTTAGGQDSHSEGNGTSAGGNYSHAQNWGTIASSAAQTAIGRYNKEHSGTTVGTPAFIIGNGSSSNRSDALTVDWSGNVDIAAGAKYKINGTDLSASDVGAVPTTRTVNSKALSSNITLSASDVGAVATSSVTTDGKAGKIPQIKSNGVLELRKYIDMHDTNSTYDYDVRIAVTQGTAAGKGTINFGCDQFNIKSSTLADFVVATETKTATGLATSWTVRKWYSGYCEAYAVTTLTGYPMTNQYGYAYYYSASATIPSGIFTSVDYAQVTRYQASNGSGLISASVYALSTTAINWYAFNSQSGTVNASFVIRVIGKWK